MSVEEVFRRITTALDETGIAYMLTGSFASAYYGAPRTTQDIDLIIEASADQLHAFVNALPRNKYYVNGEAALDAQRRESMFNVIDMETGWKIDFIIRKSRAFSQEEFRRRTPVQWQGIGLFLASPEDVLLSKLEWAHLGQSQRHIEDVAGILRLRDSLDLTYIERWIAELGLSSEWENARRLAEALDK